MTKISVINLKFQVLKLLLVLQLILLRVHLKLEHVFKSFSQWLVHIVINEFEVMIIVITLSSSTSCCLASFFCGCLRDEGGCVSLASSKAIVYPLRNQSSIAFSKPSFLGDPTGTRTSSSKFMKKLSSKAR